jgi:hypothetical protein
MEAVFTPSHPAARPGGGPKDEETYYDAVKRELAARQAATRSLLDALDPATRAAMEGLRPGTYVRMRFRGTSGMSCHWPESRKRRQSAARTPGFPCVMHVVVTAQACPASW